MSSAEAAALASPAKSADETGGGGSEAPDADLPKALLKRIIKARLSQLDAAAGGDGKRDFQINKVGGCTHMTGTQEGAPAAAKLGQRLQPPADSLCLLPLLTLLQDALLACAEAGKLFIHYLTATANDACKDARRQTISADDVLTALGDLEFAELVEPLKEALEGGLGSPAGDAFLDVLRCELDAALAAPRLVRPPCHALADGCLPARLCLPACSLQG
jgi:DNA polymerase epsilon subunit 3